MHDLTNFNIRVYGLLINNENEILIVREKIGENYFVKFPGGGLEFGEGLKDCLIREFKEETSLDIEIKEHFYTTDFFQPSAFRKSDQIISVYYKVTPLQNVSLIRLDEFEVNHGKRIETLHFSWVKLNNFNSDLLSLPIDKVVCEMLVGGK